jgi:hypothetical protein
MILAGGLGAVAFRALPAQAQSRGSVDQIGMSQPVGMQQVSRPPAAATGSPAKRQNGSSSPQVSSVSESSSPTRQLTGERGSGPASEQLTKGARSAEPSQPLSAPKDGRTATIERVAGSDRCDPKAEGSRSAKCAAVIENRAAEFARRERAPLSPEQRIIIEQQARERSGSFSDAARRLAVSGDDTESIEAQGVASIVLGAPAPKSRNETPAQDPAAADQLDAIVNAIINQPRPQ